MSRAWETEVTLKSFGVVNMKEQAAKVCSRTLTYGSSLGASF